MKKKNLVSIVLILIILVVSATNVWAVSGDSNEVITGTYHFTATENSAIQRENTFEYRDDCFTHSSFLGCKHLEILSIQAAAASITKYGDENVEYEVDVSTGPENIIEFLEEMKFNNISTNKYYTKEMKEHSIGVVVGNKTIVQDGESYTLLAIVPRNAGYKQEWYGDMHLGDGDIHEGFKYARDEILRFVKKYITENGIEGKLKVWISGYSRGAGVADMLGGFLAGGGIAYFGESVSIEPEDIYCYSIGTPNTVKNGLSKNIELSVSGNRNDDDYADDTPGEDYNYTKGGVLDVNDNIYNGIRNIVSPQDFFTIFPPEEYSFTNYGNEINANENLSSIEDYYNELKNISSEIYDSYIANDEQKPFMIKTFDLKTLQIVDTDEESNPADFIKERLGRILQLIKTNQKYEDEHYQDALSSALSTYGMAYPVLKDITEEDINIKDAIPLITFSYMDYVSHRLVEEGTADDLDDAYAIAVKDVLEYFLDINIDLDTYTIDDFLASLAKYLSENENEQVMTYGINTLIEKIPEDYVEILMGALKQFVEDQDEATLEQAFKEYVKACYNGPNPNCYAYQSGDMETPKDARKIVYFVLATMFAGDYPDVVGLLYDEETGVEGQKLFTDAVKFVVENCMTFKDENGDIVEDYDNFSDGADGKIRKVINAIYDDRKELFEELYGKEYSNELKKHIDTLCENVTEARKVLSEFFLYTKNDYNVSDIVSNFSTIIANAKLIPIEHYEELYLAKSRNANRYPECSFKVTYDSNGGTEVKSQEIGSGEKAIKPKEPMQEGLHFIGWFENPTLDNIYYYELDESGDVIFSSLRYNTFDFDTPITEDKTLTALWVAGTIINTDGEGSFSIQGPDIDDTFTNISHPVIIGMTNSITLTAIPDDYYTFVKWTKDGEDYSGDEVIKETVTRDTEFIAVFDEIKYTVTYDANGGSGTMSGDNTQYYIFPDCTFTAPEEKTFDKWEVNGEKYIPGDDIRLTEDITVKATWKNKSTSSGGGGSSSSSTVTPANASVKKNADQEFSFKVNDGYEITDVLVDGKSIGIVDKYKIEKVTANHTIEVKTAKVSAIENVDEWASDEMKRAEELGLIPETFAKKDATKPITRLDFAAVAVKLYEAISGKKVEEVVSKPFTDTDDSYVLKAYALGITLGTSENTFTPNMEITREQMATMLTRALTKAGINTTVDNTNTSKFADDSDMHDWGKPSVYFMAGCDIIKGVGDNKFNGLGNAKIEEAIAIALRSVINFSK